MQPGAEMNHKSVGTEAFGRCLGEDKLTRIFADVETSLCE